MIIERKVTKPWPVPGTNYVLPKGSMVTVPAIQMARDPAFYENPGDYNPDNFNQDAEASRSQYINGMSYIIYVGHTDELTFTIA